MVIIRLFYFKALVNNSSNYSYMIQNTQKKLNNDKKKKIQKRKCMTNNQKNMEIYL